MKNIILIIFAVVLNQNIKAQNYQPMIEDYLKVKDALVKSDKTLAETHARNLLQKINNDHLLKKETSLIKKIKIIEASKDIEKQRIALAEISEKIWVLIKKTNIENELYYQYCPMKNAYWISNEETIKNPYYGSKMLTCGTVKETKKQ